MAAEVPQDDSAADLNQEFHPAKRRKFYRRRHSDDERDKESRPELRPECLTTVHLSIDELVNSHGAASNDTEMPAEEDALPISELLRLRRAAQRRRGGIEFTNANNTLKEAASVPQTNSPLFENDDAVADVDTVINRFAPQTGQVADVDKHMMAYIDSELAKRRQGQNNSNLLSNGHSMGGFLHGDTAADLALHRQPAALGKLHEIDLGPDAKLRNIAMTEAARRRLEGVPDDVEEGTGKIRLRRDGKPWRGRRRRNSQDVKRDQLVEEVLRESRLEIYDEPEADAANDDQAADDRIAEQFRREFMDAISSRRQRTGPATMPKPVKGAKVDDRPKGPKLGGSRSARAAMRELQEKAVKK